MHKMRVETTDIAGLLILRLHVQHNDVGWFKEDWHREKMSALGLPDFGPVQHNITHNQAKGITRGFIAEPWDRLITLVSGRAMGAWVDLREGDSFGKLVTADLDPGTAVFVPRGIAHAHQVLQDHTTFSYLLNHHWTPEARASMSTVHLFDPTLDVTWPIPREQAHLAHADLQQPMLAGATPMPPRRTLVVGTETRLGRALLAELPGAVGLTAADLEPLTRAESPVDLSAYDTIVNAQGTTASDALKPSHDRQSWTMVAASAQHLTDIARRHRMRYVHISADCAFDRMTPSYPEDEPLSLFDPQSQGLAMAEVVAATVPRHIVIRTGWVVARENSVVDELVAAARHGRSLELPRVQHGRLTFASTLAAGITHLLDSGAASGTYNLTGEGPVVTWADVSACVSQVYTPEGVGEGQKKTTAQSGNESQSGSGMTLNLNRIKSAGFRPENSWRQLKDYLPMAGARRTHVTSTGTETRPGVPVTAVDGSQPFKVLFVCTANICRSAYADVVARGSGLDGVTFSSAGTHALVGKPIDPPMAARVGNSGDVSAHRGRQLTLPIIAQADLVLAMGVEHRRYVLDEWPALGRKAFVIGHVAREMARLPDVVNLESLSSHLWKHRSSDPGDGVPDPYGQGPDVTARCAHMIDSHLDAILHGFKTLTTKRSHHGR